MIDLLKAKVLSWYVFGFSTVTCQLQLILFKYLENPENVSQPEFLLHQQLMQVIHNFFQEVSLWICSWHFSTLLERPATRKSWAVALFQLVATCNLCWHCAVGCGLYWEGSCSPFFSWEKHHSRATNGERQHWTVSYQRPLVNASHQGWFARWNNWYNTFIN